MMTKVGKEKELTQAKGEFVQQWGAIGSAWGINRTMAQIHALLMVSVVPMSTDQVMEELQISRGNAHANLRELVGWGLIRSVIVKGERKEFFEAEKDVWKMATTIARERRRRELDPALEVLKNCENQTANLDSEEAIAFTNQMKELREFVNMSGNVLDKVAKLEETNALKLVKTMFR